MEGEINRQRNLPYEKVASVIVDSNVIDDGQREKNLYVLSLIEGLQRLHLRRRSHVYTHFKKRCRRERRMAVVERKLHDRKELWFPY